MKQITETTKVFNVIRSSIKPIDKNLNLGSQSNPLDSAQRKRYVREFQGKEGPSRIILGIFRRIFK